MNNADRLTQRQFSSFDMEAPVVIQESYLLTVDVKKIALTQSLAHVTGKMLVAITSNDQVYSIENSLFSARRQHKSEAEAAAERALIEATTFGPRNESERVWDVKNPLLP